MMTLGPQATAHLARAETLRPEDPRIHLLVGVGVMHKPVNFGGGPLPAIDEFRRAQECFAKESVADSTAPDWGRDDAFLWEGRAQMAAHDYAAAKAAFQRALEANPRNGWVKTKLLPDAIAASAKAMP
jgi:Flp pilus assembly protein TadD